MRVRSPAVSSTVRGSDCQVDGRVVSLSIRRSPANPLSERSTVPSRADIRVLLSETSVRRDRHGGLPFSRHAEHGVVWPSAAVADL